jgi:hypothetical protein
MEQNAIKSTFGTKKETILYNTAAVIGRPGKEIYMGNPPGYHCIVFTQGVGQ